MGWPVAAAIGAAAAQQGMQEMGNAKAGFMGYHLGKKMLKKQMAANAYMFQNRYQWTVQDLRKAGLNPMLALGHGSGQVPGSMGLPATGVQGVSQPDVAGSALQLANIPKVAQETKTEKERTQLVLRQRFETLSREMRNVSEKGKLNAEADKAWSVSRLNAKIWNRLTAEIDNMRQTLKNLKEQEEQTQADIIRIESLTKEIRAREMNFKALNSKIAIELVKMKRMKNIREDAKLLYYIETTLEALRMHNAVIFTPTKGE